MDKNDPIFQFITWNDEYAEDIHSAVCYSPLNRDILEKYFETNEAIRDNLICFIPLSKNKHKLTFIKKTEDTGLEYKKYKVEDSFIEFLPFAKIFSYRLFSRYCFISDKHILEQINSQKQHRIYSLKPTLIKNKWFSGEWIIRSFEPLPETITISKTTLTLTPLVKKKTSNANPPLSRSPKEDDQPLEEEGKGEIELDEVDDHRLETRRQSQQKSKQDTPTISPQKTNIPTTTTTQNNNNNNNKKTNPKYLPSHFSSDSVKRIAEKTKQKTEEIEKLITLSAEFTDKLFGEIALLLSAFLDRKDVVKPQGAAASCLKLIETEILAHPSPPKAKAGQSSDGTTPGPSQPKDNRKSNQIAEKANK